MVKTTFIITAKKSKKEQIDSKNLEAQNIAQYFSCFHSSITGWEFTKLLRQICKISVTLKCFYGVVIHKNRYFMIYTVVNITL